MSGDGNIVRDYYSGNTHIKVADDYYRDKTSEEIEKILRDVAALFKEVTVRYSVIASASVRSDTSSSYVAVGVDRAQIITAVNVKSLIGTYDTACRRRIICAQITCIVAVNYPSCIYHRSRNYAAETFGVRAVDISMVCKIFKYSANVNRRAGGCICPASKAAYKTAYHTSSVDIA